MLHELPITNVRLLACHKDWEQMTPTAQGRHCQSCHRTVIDFTRGSAADLARARAASPDGRVCGRFSAGQLTATHRPAPQLRPRWRLFLAAVVLVLVQGLSAREAWAQVKRSQHHPSTAKPARPAKAQLVEAELLGDVAPLPVQPTLFEGRPLWHSPDQAPRYPVGGDEGLQRTIASQAQRPTGRVDVEGRVFVRCVIDREGRVRNPQVLKGLDPELDQRALRIVQGLGPFVPGRQNGQPVDVEFTMVVPFPGL